MLKIQKEKYNQIYLFAPMSSGKSTIINAILGENVLPTSNYACTAKKYEIVINKNIKERKLYIDDVFGKTKVISNITYKDIEAINENNEKYLSVMIESNMVSDIISKKPLLFVDTPGANYYYDDNHAKITYHILSEIHNSLILYILNTSQLGTEDDVKMLKAIAKVISGDNKSIFVLNKADVLNREKESIMNYVFNIIPQYLKSNGIEKYHICPCSAEAALLFRRALRNREFSEAEADKLYKYFKYFNKRNIGLGYYAYDNCCVYDEREIVVDGKKYSTQELYMALKNTGIYELENSISKQLDSVL